MLGSITVEYNDLEDGENKEEDFDDVDSVSVAGNPDSVGDTLIVAHTDERPNTVRNGVALQRIA